ncbi:GNAT family N-acetyltransferase [Veronia nyctiphanis]|uniref:GNAT family N-acetyltransferase n=1 Tax=Veronia nyctiphanis TaxID=1278244 RepID=A0A4V1LST7_9GAMM|nr:GNAT family N-acetyltransferase [Veronia nyctiphanis]RXJ72838.1 GNAT family N-acetyltransferase [Veronia nyctiphanis]
MKISTITAQQVLPIRHQVLWPDKPVDFSQVKGDDTATHYGAFIEGELVSVGSIFIDGDTARLRKFATLSAHQGKGVGTAMLHVMLSDLKSSSVKTFWCDARESAMAIYQRIGMKAEGERFHKSDIPYFKMQMPVSSKIANHLSMTYSQIQR